MKRCPQCYEAYDNSEKFCELDGQPLLSDPAMTISASEDPGEDLAKAQVQNSVPASQREIWFVGVAGVMAGIVVCAGSYLAYGLWTKDSGYKENSAPAVVTKRQEPLVNYSRPQPPRPEATATPAETATAEPEVSPEPQPVLAKPENNTPPARLNQGPVTTGQQKKGAEETGAVQTVIEMNDGTSVEVDAAWEDNQGVWYRRGGMVAFVDSQRVKAIIGRAAQKPSSQ